MAKNKAIAVQEDKLIPVTEAIKPLSLYANLTYDFEDKITGYNDSNDKIYGGKGNDTLIGKSGNDTLNGGTGNDNLDGGEGFDTLEGGQGHDTLIGKSGNDELYGGEGNDTLYGNEFEQSSSLSELDITSDVAGINKSKEEGVDNDILNGGKGNDTMYGGAGHDIYYIGGQDTVIDSDYSGEIYFLDKNYQIKPEDAERERLFKQYNITDRMKTWEWSKDIPEKDLEKMQPRTLHASIVSTNPSEGKATFEAELGNEKYRLEVHGIKLLVTETTWEIDHETGQHFLIFDPEVSRSIFHYNNVIITELSTGHQVRLETPFNIRLNDRMSINDGEYSHSYPAIWNDFRGLGNSNSNHEEDKENKRENNPLSDDEELSFSSKEIEIILPTAKNTRNSFNAYKKDNKTTDIKFTDTKATETTFSMKGNDLVLSHQGNPFLTVLGFYNSPHNNLQNFRFSDRTLSLEQMKTDGITLSGTESDDIMYDWNKTANTTFRAGKGNDKINAGDGNDTLIGGTGNDLLQGGNGKDTYVFEKGHGQDIITEFNTTKDEDTIQFDDINFNQMKFRRDNYDLTLFGYHEQDSLTIKAFFADQANQLENYQFSDRTLTREQFNEEIVLADTQVNRMIQTAANFGVRSSSNSASVIPNNEIQNVMPQLAPSV